MSGTMIKVKLVSWIGMKDEIKLCQERIDKYQQQEDEINVALGGMILLTHQDRLTAISKLKAQDNDREQQRI